MSTTNWLIVFFIALFMLGVGALMERHVTSACASDFPQACRQYKCTSNAQCGPDCYCDINYGDTGFCR